MHDDDLKGLVQLALPSDSPETFEKVTFLNICLKLYSGIDFFDKMLFAVDLLY